MNAKSRIETSTTVGAIILSLFFLGLTIPHSADVLSNFEKRGSWLPWMFAIGLEVLVAFAMYIVCESSFAGWVRSTAGGLVAVAIIASVILNYSHYLAVNGNALFSFGLAALLPGLVAGLGAMLPGLIGGEKQTEMISAPPIPIDPMPILQEALAAMKRQLEESSSKALEMISARLPEMVRNELQAVRVMEIQTEMISEISAPISEMEINPKEISVKWKSEGMTVSEIAEKLGKSERMVRNYLKE